MSLNLENCVGADKSNCQMKLLTFLSFTLFHLPLAVHQVIDDMRVLSLQKYYYQNTADRLYQSFLCGIDVFIINFTAAS